MVILVLLIVLLSVVVVLCDERLGFWAKLSLTFIGLGVHIPASYLVKTKEYPVNGLLLPAMPLPSAYLTLVIILSIVMICFLLNRYLSKLKMRSS